MKYMYSNTKIYKKHWLNKREYWREKKSTVKIFQSRFSFVDIPWDAISLAQSSFYTIWSQRGCKLLLFLDISPNQTKKNLKELLSEYNFLYKCYCFVLGFQTVNNCLIWSILRCSVVYEDQIRKTRSLRGFFFNI